LLGKPGIFRPLLEYCTLPQIDPALEAMPTTEARVQV